MCVAAMRWLSRVAAAALLTSVWAGCESACKPGQPCWPSDADVAALVQGLDPGAGRSLRWDKGKPRVSAVPVGSAGDQPLFGANTDLQPLYVREGPAKDCDFPMGKVGASEFCLQSLRSLPLTDTQPAFVAWPLTAGHVQRLIRFAREHGLAVSIAGTGHDFMGRHSCRDSLFIRTALMKDIEWHLNGTDALQQDHVNLGPGLVWSEVFASGLEQQPMAYTAAGWAQTVGVVGWTLGGGHGPFGRAHGYGAENLLSLEVVTSDGELVTASVTQNADLFWALRGGGGSTWGVVTGLTMRAYKQGQGGLTLLTVSATGNNCKEGLEALEGFVKGYLSWTATLGGRFSGCAMRIPADGDCGGGWSITMLYNFMGGATDPELLNESARFQSLVPSPSPSFNHTSQGVPLPHWYSYMATKPISIDWIHPGIHTPAGLGAHTSVSVDHGQAFGGRLGAILVSTPGWSLFHDIPGTVCSDRPAAHATALGDAFRVAEFHVVVGGLPAEYQDAFYALGNSSYFGESAIYMENWKSRYWGSKYEKLLSVKQRYDPDNLFWCRQCVGSDLPGRGQSVIAV